MTSGTRITRMLTMATAGAMLGLGLTAQTTTAAAPAQAAAEPRAATSGFRTCYDLECTKRIREGRSFNANGRHGITRVTIQDVSRNGVRLTWRGSGASGSCSGSPHLSCTINGVQVRSWDREGNTAMFRFNA